jgi:hypothetical protein
LSPPVTNAPGAVSRRGKPPLSCQGCDKRKGWVPFSKKGVDTTMKPPRGRVVLSRAAAACALLLCCHAATFGDSRSSLRGAAGWHRYGSRDVAAPADDTDTAASEVLEASEVLAQASSQPSEEDDFGNATSPRTGGGGGADAGGKASRQASDKTQRRGGLSRRGETPKARRMWGSQAPAKASSQAKASSSETTTHPTQLLEREE